MPGSGYPEKACRSHRARSCRAPARRNFPYAMPEGGPWDSAGPGSRCLAMPRRRKEEGLVAATVNLGKGNWAADAEARRVLDAGAALQRERIAGPEPGRRVIIEHAAVELIRPRFGDDCHLSDGAEFGAVVGHIGADFRIALDIVDQGADLAPVIGRADADAVKRHVPLIAAASGQAA